MKLFQDLNKDQLDGLAKLSFDLAKGAYLVALLPTVGISRDFLAWFIKTAIALILGIAFTYIALILLKRKGKVKE